jgi:hypothetical protein
MTTPDIAGLCKRLRDNWDWPSLLMTEAADTLERQAAENKRLRVALERIADPRNIHFAGDAQVVARAALTGEDAATLSLSGETQTDDRTRGDG